MAQTQRIESRLRKRVTLKRTTKTSGTWKMVLAAALIASITASCTNGFQTKPSASNESVEPSSEVSAGEPTFKNEIPLAVRAAAKATVSASGSAALNPTGATRVIAFLDPQDQFSARTYLALKAAAESNKDIALVIRFKTNSSSSISRAKAKYLYAANAQNRFFDLADAVFGSALKLKTEADLANYAQQIGIDSKKLASDASLAATDAKISTDETDLQTLGSAKAPSIYVNGVRVYDYEVSNREKALAVIAKVGG